MASESATDTADSTGGVTTPCGWCGVPLARSTRPSGWTVAACASCGAYTTVPQPTEAELDAAYGAWYRPQQGRFGTVGDALLRFGRTRLARRLDALAPPGPIVDVGAGDGALVDAIIRRGRDALGLERVARGEHVQALDFSSLGGDWAAVVMWHTLEHLREPGAAIRHARSLLLDGGLLIVAIPNAGSIQARLFGERWFAWDLPRHLVHLPARTLVDGLERAGLRVTRVSHWRGGQVLFGWLHGLVALLPGNPSLYDAIRIPAARAASLTAGERAAVLAAAIAALPLAALAALAELLLRRGGTVYVEARRG